jgi:non-specific serine/threonine protein kinase
VTELRLIPCLTPHGRLTLVTANDAPELEEKLARRLREGFARGSGHGILRIGAGEVGRVLPPAFAYWRELGARYVSALCARPDIEEIHARIPAPPEEDLGRFALAAPAMPGAEYLTADVLRALWEETDAAFSAELDESGATARTSSRP